jgi:CRP-like cAMP-binding protein
VRLFSHDARIDTLREVPLFRDLPKRALSQLAGHADEAEVEAGTVLCSEGEFGSEFFVVLDGEAEVTKRGEHVAVLGPGSFFGEIAIVAQTQRTATVAATSPLRFLVLTKQSFWTLLEEQPDVQRIVLETLAKRLAELEQSY